MCGCTIADAIGGPLEIVVTVVVECDDTIGGAIVVAVVVIYGGTIGGICAIVVAVG